MYGTIVYWCNTNTMPKNACDFLLLPVYATEADGEFMTVCSVMCDALTTTSVPRAILRTRAIYVIMWTGHGGY